MHRFAPATDAPALVVPLADTTRVVSGVYVRELTYRGGARWRERIMVTHEFRRRPVGWCAAEGRTVRLLAPVLIP